MKGIASFGQAKLETCWPRAGLGGSNVATGECVGRFVAAGGKWRFESAFPGIASSGDGDLLDNLARVFRAVCSISPNAGMIGYLAYETGYNLLELPAPSFPDNDVRIPASQFLFFDALSLKTTRVDEIPLRFDQPRSYTSDDLERIASHPSVHPHTERKRYEDSIHRIKAHISAGDIYQANLTQAFDVQTGRDGAEIYRVLTRMNPAPFSAYLRFEAVRIADGSFPQLEVLSCSPERFWRKRGRQVETRPIKGTIGRGNSRKEDKDQLRKLLTSAKDRAELLMITDLLRNDLGRCAEIGTVQTPFLRRLRACASVWHLESVVTAKVPTEVGWQDVMRSLFPGGSITGAPKRRAVEILSGLETVPRGVYCGAVGWVNAAGDCDFALPIRTVVKSGTLTRVMGGGGIVADSDAASEYEESLVKIAPILECLCQDSDTSQEGHELHAKATADLT
jgi:anthranilate/para-aminobenzoate synthase component I